MTQNAQRNIAISLEIEWAYKRHLEVFAGCQKYADEAGWNCRIHPAIDRTVDTADNPHFDGIIARATPSIEAFARQTKTPLVNVWLNSPAKNLPGVFPDYTQAGVIGAEHLLSRGFTHFGYLGSGNDLESRQIYDGFRTTIESRGLTCSIRRYSRSKLTGTAPGWEEFVTDIEEWIETWDAPTGVMVAHDLHARYFADICRSKNLKISGDVAIVSTDNEPIICDSLPPTLTSIDVGFAQIGYQAAARLERLMNGEPLDKLTHLIPPTKLVPRQSTDLYACNDTTVSNALRFIAENSHRKIAVEDVVRAVTTNRRGLERRFKASLGKSISGEITRLRVERAKRHLAETDFTMKEVAAASGFRDADHFYKVFNRIEGTPPTSYREKHQQLFAFDDDTLTQ